MDTLHVIAHMHSDFSTKFGIPRQSGLVSQLRSTIVFEPEYRSGEALRGLEDFSHLWLIWGFSENAAGKWSPTVRPPRLGGNARMGVFATRSPYRPNPLGLSAVVIDEISQHPTLGAVVHVLGGDLMDGTPIYDIKPYLPFSDCLPEARGGFAAAAPGALLTVDAPLDLLEMLPAQKREALCQVLALDPRPAYQDDPSRVYGMEFSDFDVRFRVSGDKLTVVSVVQKT